MTASDPSITLHATYEHSSLQVSVQDGGEVIARLTQEVASVRFSQLIPESRIYYGTFRAGRLRDLPHVSNPLSAVSVPRRQEIVHEAFCAKEEHGVLPVVTTSTVEIDGNKKMVVGERIQLFIARQGEEPAASAASIGYQFRDPQLLALALTHRSYANEHPGQGNNERLEFLGDAALGLITAEHLYRLFPGDSEGDLTRKRADMARADTCAAAVRELDIVRQLRLGHGEALTRGRDKESIQADLFEALLGAIYLDGGLEATRRYVLERLRGRGEGAETNHKGHLQEIAQAQGLGHPVYKVVKESGPDHQKEFVVCVSIRGKPFGTGKGRSKREAEQSAAEAVLEKLTH